MREINDWIWLESLSLGGGAAAAADPEGDPVGESVSRTVVRPSRFVTKFGSLVEGRVIEEDAALSGLKLARCFRKRLLNAGASDPLMESDEGYRRRSQVTLKTFSFYLFNNHSIRNKAKCSNFSAVQGMTFKFRSMCSLLILIGRLF